MIAILGIFPDAVAFDTEAATYHMRSGSQQDA